MASAKRILLVDGDAVPRHSLAEQLAREGAYAVTQADSAAGARAAAQSQDPFAFAIIDAALPDGGGEALAQALRESGFAAPILLLTPDANAVSAAAEPLLKPFRLAALLARISARHPGADVGMLSIGPYQLRPNAKLLTDGKARKVRLTEKETDILRFLAAAGRTVPRETLLHEVWGYSPTVTTHTLETHIYRLRRKIEENPARARILLTEGGGYRLA